MQLAEICTSQINHDIVQFRCRLPPFVAVKKHSLPPMHFEAHGNTLAYKIFPKAILNLIQVNHLDGLWVNLHHSNCWGQLVLQQIIPWNISLWLTIGLCSNRVAKIGSFFYSRTKDFLKRFSNMLNGFLYGFLCQNIRWCICTNHFVWPISRVKLGFHRWHDIVFIVSI